MSPAARVSDATTPVPAQAGKSSAAVAGEKEGGGEAVPRRSGSGGGARTGAVSREGGAPPQDKQLAQGSIAKWGRKLDACFTK